jgi:hypothetical protein
VDIEKGGSIGGHPYHRSAWLINPKRGERGRRIEVRSVVAARDRRHNGMCPELAEGFDKWAPPLLSRFAEPSPLRFRSTCVKGNSPGRPVILIDILS